MSHVIVLIRDLMFSSRVSSAAAQSGTPVTMLRDPARLKETVGEKLIIDLNLPGAIEAAQEWKQASPQRQVCGFVSHMDTETIGRARAAGVDHVLARSQFVAPLADLLK